jgi:hypothetical protein
VSLFFKEPTEKTMLDALAEYVIQWPEDEFTTSKMSRDLKELRQDGFLDAKKAVPVRTSRVERSYAYPNHKKTIFFLSEIAKTAKLAIDSDRWVMLNGVYLASARERRPKQSFFTLPASKRKQTLTE